VRRRSVATEGLVEGSACEGGVGGVECSREEDGKSEEEEEGGG